MKAIAAPRGEQTFVASCTNPGIAIVSAGEAANAFAIAAASALSEVGAQPMLTRGMAEAYRYGRDRIAAGAGVQEILTSTCELRHATPFLYRTSAKAWLSKEALGEEVFGPLGLIVEAADGDEMRAVALSLKGQLTCTLHLDDADVEMARSLLPVLDRKAGRVLANGFPTGVEVCDTMVHGGPYPASTNFGGHHVHPPLPAARLLPKLATEHSAARLAIKLPQSFYPVCYKRQRRLYRKGRLF